MEPLPASYYGPLDKNNPVLLNFQSDLKHFKTLIKQMLGSPNVNHRSYSTGSIKLFETWNKYKSRLPTTYFEENLLKIADFLFDCKLYRLALWQGYRLYTLQFSTISLESVKDVKHFKKIYFSHGLGTKRAPLTLRALLGESQCSFYLEREKGEQPDPRGVQRMLSILGFLRILMEAIHPYESLCWLLYNGSLCTYNICKFLMSVGHASEVLEYVLWACTCLEASVPLMNSSFLSWRATLYCAVCECYFYNQATVQAEVFARRALGKISELAKLEEMTGLPMPTETQQAYKGATIKLAVMVFKRAVYEHRRKPKGLFKPKQRGNLKELQQGPWPRTPTEHILMELFEGNAAQFLAVLEALHDSSVRPLQTGMPDEFELQEVVMELISAGISLLSGFGSQHILDTGLPSSVNAVDSASNLYEMALAGDSKISVDAAVKFVKQLFRYEQWSMFESIFTALMSVLNSMQGRMHRKYELELMLLKAVECLIAPQRVKFGMKEIADKIRNIGSAIMTDEFFNAIQTLHACVCRADKDIRPDADLVLDIIQLLWSRCQTVFQWAQIRHDDPIRYLGKLENQEQWVQTLLLLCEVAHEHQLAEVDFIPFAEMTLRLAMVLESLADAPPPSGGKTEDSKESTPTDKPEMMERSRAEQLQTTFDLIERSVVCISMCRARLSSGGFAVYDGVFMQKFSDTKSSTDGRGPEDSYTPDRNVLAMDLHLELLAFQHRLSLKLCDSCTEEIGMMEGKILETNRLTEESVLLEKIKKNKISKCVFLTQKALLTFKKDQTNKETKKILEEAVTLIERAEVEERRLVSILSPPEINLRVMEKKQPPPVPVLLSRTDHSMTFTPGPYALEEEVCWYCIFGKEAEGVNLKVRLKDCHLRGTGEMIPARSNQLLHISGLETNRKYIFAVAAFDAQGRMVGSGIGETTRPLLASLPLPLLTTWAHLAQVSYQAGLHSLAKRACKELWSHFTFPASPNPDCPKPEQEACLEGLAQTRLRPATVQVSSPILHQLFLSTIFIETDIHIQEGVLFCDCLCDEGPLIWGQEARLAECERMLVAVDLSLHIDDSSNTLQAVVNCYGLLAPLIFYQIPSERVIEVVLKCFTVLLEIPEVLKQKQPATTAESLQHMIACLTYYLAKSLSATQKTGMASSVIESGKKLLQKISEPLLQPSKKPQLGQKKRENKEVHEHLMALNSVDLTSMQARHEVTACNEPEFNGHVITGQEDPAVIYKVFENQPLQIAFQEVMKFKQRSCFLEFVARLIQKALLEDQLDLVIQWEQSILDWFSRRDEDLLALKNIHNQAGEEGKEFTTSPIEYKTKKRGNFFLGGKKWRRKKLLSVFKAQNSESEIKAVGIFLDLLGAFIRRHQHRANLRKIHLEDSLLRCHINLNLGHAYLGLLRRNLGPPPQLCFSHLPLSFFSLAQSGTMVMWHNVPQQIGRPEIPTPKTVSHPGRVRHRDKNTKHGTPNTSEEDSETESLLHSMVQCNQNPSSNEKPSVPDHPAGQTTAQLLETLSKACINIRRAMVLAHRWGHWTTLQWVCRTLWDQSSSLVLMIERIQRTDAHNKHLTVEHIYTIITPLLVLASDLLMDMMEKLKLWKDYDTKEDDLEASLYFSAPVDDGTMVDLRWLRNLVLHTLELLFYQAKWKSLVHLALAYNTYTRQRYSYMVTPLLVYAQRRLLDGVSCQPIITNETGETVSCRIHAGKQLQFPHENDGKGAMCEVGVPLDVEDTLRCFRKTLEGRHYALSTFQHSQTLLHLLLAGTQHHVEGLYVKEPSGVLQGKVEFNLASSTPPGVNPLDISAEDYSNLGSIYKTTLPPSKIQTVLSSYNNAIKYLQANKYNSLQVQALHDLGNLYFYKGNRKSAHSSWSKALDCALHNSGVLDYWDGDSLTSNTFQETLRDAGIWGCLQGALLSAKIAQHIFTSNINQRTKCCLLATRLFKCLLMASMPHPTMDMAYSTYTVGTELIPGINLFSEPDRGNLGTTVASLSFLCHWLYNSGHFLKALPMLALFLYIAKTVCRDLHLTVTCRILKIKVLTELRMFSQAVEELSTLTSGEEIPLHHGGNNRTGELSRASKIFLEGKPVMDPCNVQALEDVVNRSPSGDIIDIYGSKLIRWLLMAKVDLILAICSTIHTLPEPMTPGPETEEQSSDTCSLSSDVVVGNTLDNIQKPKGLQLDAKYTLGQVKTTLLQKAHSLVSPEIIAHQQITDPEELELEVEIRLLMSNINQQQGRMAASADLAVSAMNLLQSSLVFHSDFCPQPPPTPPSSSLRRSRSKVHPISSQESKSIPSLQTGDAPAWVQARERMDGLFWLRCRLAVIRSLAGHIPGTSIYSGVDSSAEALRVLKEGLEEADAWGDPDTKALLLMQGVKVNMHCGKPREDSTSMLQEIVSLLSGRVALSPRSQMALAEAALLLSELRGTGSQTLHLLTQKLLKQQLSALGEFSDLKKEVELQSECLKNIYHLQLPLLVKTTMRMGHSLALEALASFSEEGHEPWRPLVAAQDVLQFALNILQSSANRDLHLEADILYCTGLLGRHLVSMQKNDPRKVLEAFLQCVLFHNSHSHNLSLIHRCYMEMALICLNQWEKIVPPSVHEASATTHETSKETFGRNYPLIFWVCLRMALKTSEALSRSNQCQEFPEDAEGLLSPSSIKVMPDFALNDLLHPCGGLENHGKLNPRSQLFMDTEHQLTWMQISRYYTHLQNLLRVSSRPGAVKGADGLISVAGDSNLALRLSQLHTFFSCHLPLYRECWALPNPPAALILEPQLIQESVSVPGLYAWASTDIQELLIQWYRPLFEENMILLVFVVNNAPLSATSPSAEAIAGQQAGQILVCIDRLKAVHALLSSLCREMEGNGSPIACSNSSISPQEEKQRRTSSSTQPRQDMLFEKTTRVCTEIRDLLEPDFNSTPITELPFDPNTQTLCDLERCFDPSTGSVLRDTRCISWLLSVLVKNHN